MVRRGQRTVKLIEILIAYRGSWRLKDFNL